MSRPVVIQHPPRRSKCKDCQAPIWRVYAGSWGQSILFDRDGNKPLSSSLVGVQSHRCPRKEP